MRYEKTLNGQTINHVWDGNQQIIADVIDNQFYEANCYIRGTNLVAKYNYWNGKKSEYTYYTQNAHGDVVNLTDKDGKVTKSYRYDAFGVEKNIDENDTNTFRYCGEYYDKETATVYLRARNYNPSIGRFISRDSYPGKNEDPLSLNLYTYCENNPIYYSDPSGHDAVAAANYMINNPRPSTINSAHDAKLLNEWRNEFKRIINSSITINSAGDAALYQKATSTPSFKVNSTGDAKILENQKNFYKVVNNIQRNNLTASIMVANSIKPKVDSQIPPNHPLYKPPKKGVRSVKDRVKNPNGPGKGWPAKDGGVWIPDNNMHGGSGWTVQYPGGGTRELEISLYNEKSKSRYRYDDDLQFRRLKDNYYNNTDNSYYFIVPYEFSWKLIW